MYLTMVFTADEIVVLGLDCEEIREVQEHLDKMHESEQNKI